MKARTPIGLILLGGLLGFTVAWFADASIPTMAGLFLVQPAVALAMILVVGLLVSRRKALAIAALALMAYAAPPLLMPSPTVGAWPEVPALGCASIAPPARELRVVTFNTRGKSTEGEARRLATKLREVDVVVLQEVGSKTFVEVLADELGGEGVFSVTMGRYGQGIVVRNGVIPRCFCVQRYLEVPLPAAQPRRAAAIVAYARFADGMVPIVSFHTDRPGAWADVGDWPENLRDSAKTLGAVARELPAAIVVAGDSNTTPSFRHFNAGLGLHRATPRWSWPEPVPVLALDGVWYGPAWESDETTAMSAPVDSDHRMVDVLLRPR